jgi:hypothetical protein
MLFAGLEKTDPTARKSGIDSRLCRTFGIDAKGVNTKNVYRAEREYNEKQVMMHENASSSCGAWVADEYRRR